MNGGEAHIVSTVYLYTTIWSRKKRGSFTPRTYFSLVHFTIQLKANNEDFLSFIPLWYTYTSEDLPNVSGFTNVLSVKIGLGRELVNPIYHHLPVKGVNNQTKPFFSSTNQWEFGTSMASMEISLLLKNKHHFCWWNHHVSCKRVTIAA